MASNAELYLERAADFEEKARLTFNASEKIAYLELANAYRQLGGAHKGRVVPHT